MHLGCSDGVIVVEKIVVKESGQIIYSEVEEYADEVNEFVDLPTMFIKPSVKDIEWYG